MSETKKCECWSCRHSGQLTALMKKLDSEEDRQMIRELYSMWENADLDSDYWRLKYEEKCAKQEN